MRPNSSFEKKNLRKSDQTVYKSNNTTLCTSRPNTSPFKTSVKSANGLLKLQYPAFEYIFIEDYDSQSISINYCLNKAKELYHQKKYTFAMRLYIKALELDKIQWRAWNNLGVCYLMQKNLNDAVNCFHESIKIDKFIEISYFNISLAYLNFEKYQEAGLCVKSAKTIIKDISKEYIKLEKTITICGIEKQKSVLGQKIYSKINKNNTPPPLTSEYLRSRCSRQANDTPNESTTDVIGFNQTDIIEKSNFLRPNEEIAENLNAKIRKLRDKVIQDMKTLIKKEIPGPSKLDSKYITQEELKEIKIEFSKVKEERSYRSIDISLKKLIFFQKFNYEIRRKIYDMCEIKCFLPGEVIFSQGEVGENMYVILKGAITIQKEGPEFRGQNVIVNSIYDGRQFGELALLNSLNSSSSNNARTASCIACEKTYLLFMPKLNYSEIILLSDRNELEEKMIFFSKLSIFKGFDKKFFLALSTNIEKKTYKFNEIVLEKGEVPKGLYIIFQGYAVLYTEGYSIREKFTDKYSPIRTQRPRPKPMFFSISPTEKPKSPKLDEFEISPIIRIVKKEMNEMNSEKMITVKKFLKKNQVESLNDENHLIKDRIPFASIQEMDFFGGRAILVGQYGNTCENSPSKFSIVAQSSTVELFLITKYHLQFLTQEMNIQLLTILGKSYEVDCPPEINPQEMDNLFKSWQSFKFQLIKDIKKENYITKHKNNFPYLL